MKTFLIQLILMFIAVQSFSQCYIDRHNTSENEAWISCDKTLSPNTLRGESTWIMYDLKSTYALGSTHFWNLNSPGKTDMGIKNGIIDYSVDGVEWIEWGSFNLEESTASGFYEGEVGPDLNGIIAQYVLITITENHGGQCSGFAELRIESLGETTSVDELVEIDGNAFAYPNPAFGETQIKITSPSGINVNAQLMSMSGQRIFENVEQLIQGENTITLNLNELAEGQYIYSLSNDEYSQSININVVNK